MHALSMRRRNGRRFAGVPVLVLLLGLILGGFVTAQVATAPPAAAAVTTATNGYGKFFTFNGARYFVGDFVFSGKMRGFCIEPMKMRARTDVVGLISDLPGVSGDKEARIHAMANEAYYGYFTPTLAIQKMDTNPEGYQYAFAIWKNISANGLSRYNQAVSSHQLSAGDIAAIKAIEDRAARHGDYKVAVTLKPVKVGKSETGSVRLTNAAGYGAPVGTRVYISATGAAINSVSGVAGTKGRVTTVGYSYFNYTVTKTGPVTITVTTYQPNSYQSKVSFPPSNVYQRLIGFSSSRMSLGKASFELRAAAPAYSNVCSANCDGTGTLTVVVKNDAGKVLHEVFSDQVGRTIATVDALPGATVTKNILVVDGTRVTSKYCYTNMVGGACVTGVVVNAGSYLIECPAWATAEITVGCNCASSWASVKFTAPLAPPNEATRKYTGHVVFSKDGIVVGQMPVVSVANGQSVVVPVTMQVESGLVIEGRFSVSDGTKLLVNDKTLTKVMVLSVAGSGVSYSKSTLVGSKMVTSAPKSVMLSKSSFALAS